MFFFIGAATLALAVMAFSAPTSIVVATPVPTPISSDPNWDILAPGIDYREYHLSDPNNVYVARMVISDTQQSVTVTLESGIASGFLSSGLETVRSMATRYDQALNNWGSDKSWGANRNDVVVAINGSYFDVNSGIGVPENGMVTSGWYAKRFDDLGGGSGFGWDFFRRPFIGECVVHRPNKQIIWAGEQRLAEFQGINTTRSSDQIVIYTPQYEMTTPASELGVEILVEMTRPMMILPDPGKAMGVVREVHQGQGSTMIPFDHIVISAEGTALETLLLQNLPVGTQVGISQEVTSYQSNCSTPLNLDWSKTYASLGGAYYFLKGGQIQNVDGDIGAASRAPRTAIAYNEEYIYFIVVDGRDPFDSVGMSIEELGIFASVALSATHGISEDGGGSSTMVVNGEVVNNTFCNNYTCRGKIYLPLVVNNSPPARASSTAQFASFPYPPPGDEFPAQISSMKKLATSSASNITYERGIANGMMMVVVESPTFSAQGWLSEQTVAITATANVRLGPGTNYAAFTLAHAGTYGTIQPHSLNGVLAKGNYWWKVRLDNGAVGWITQDVLVVP